jgi:hypothetical protein
MPDEVENDNPNFKSNMQRLISSMPSRAEIVEDTAPKDQQLKR